MSEHHYPDKTKEQLDIENEDKKEKIFENTWVEVFTKYGRGYKRISDNFIITAEEMDEIIGLDEHYFTYGHSEVIAHESLNYYINIIMKNKSLYNKLKMVKDKQ